MCPIEIFGKKVRQFIEKKMGTGADPTFFDLYKKYGKNIHIMGANTTTMKGECFDINTSPFMKVIDAIEISCDLPYIFTKKIYNNQTYVDGSFINDYPVNLADNGKDECLGICVFGNTNISKNDYIGWIYRLLYMPIMELHRERVNRLSKKVTNIEIVVDGISIIDITPNKKKKINLFSTGYRQARKYFYDLIENIYNYDVLEADKINDNGDWEINHDWIDLL